MRFGVLTGLAVLMLCSSCREEQLYRPSVAIREPVEESKLAARIIAVLDEKHSYKLLAALEGPEPDSDAQLTARPVLASHTNPVRSENQRRIGTIGIETEGRQDFRVGPLGALEDGALVEIRFRAKADAPNRVIYFTGYQGRMQLKGFQKAFSASDEWRDCQLIVSVQSPVEELTLRVRTDAEIEIEDFCAYLQAP